MTEYKIIIRDSKYIDFSFVNNDTNEDIEIDIQPIEEKMFSNDIFRMDELKVDIVYSPIRSTKSIAGVLILDTNKTYGKTEACKKPGKNKSNRLLYQCIPDDHRLPIFLVPYQIQSQFSKVQNNKYVLFKFSSWTNQHPEGMLVETLGNVGNLNIFYEYQLYCKNLNISIKKFTQDTRTHVQKYTQNELIDHVLNNSIEKRIHIPNIFSIDPHNSTDFDDAFSIQHHEDSKTTISIYIANVAIWLEKLNLWDSFSERVSSIYLPDSKRPMLPNILSDDLCSLKKGEPRFAIAMDILLDETNTVLKTSFMKVLIQVENNFVYEEEALLHYEPYIQLKAIAKRMKKSTNDSHDVVSFFMVKMNMEVGAYLATNRMGIFRDVQYKHSIDSEFQEDISHLDEDTQRVMKSWTNTVGQYSNFNENIREHEFMKISNYVHTTSPIRRIVDLLNQIILLKLLGEESPKSEIFLERWLENLDYINASMRSIRKIQLNSELLERCSKQSYDAEYKGVLFDKIQNNDGLYVYMVYMKEINMMGRIKSHMDFENYSQHIFRIFIFEHEYNLKKKIQIQFSV